MSEETTLYERVGGMPFFEALVAGFYEGVAVDPILRPMYPEDDLAPASERLAWFLAQYWGGPRTYSEQRGHPRLRQRHMPFVVDAAARDAWLRCMITSLDRQQLDNADREALRTYLVSAADFLVNSPGA